MQTSWITAFSIVALIACGPQGQSADDLNRNNPSGGSVGAGGSGGTGGDPAPGSGGSSDTGGTGGGSDTGGTGGIGGTDSGGSGGSTETGGTGGSTDTGGTGGTDTESGGTGGTGEPEGPYTPRSGSFKMLVYSRTTGFRHDGSITTGKQMLQQIANEQGFEIKITETNEDISVAGLSEYEIVFFMNTTGVVFNQTEKAAFEEWMTTRNGAFAGVHSATDTENGWAFYSEVTGQYYNGHTAANTPGSIQFESSMLGFPALQGLPNPWQRNEEWYRFDNYQQWSTKPGFRLLGRKAADNQPIMWIREWGNFRAFYTALGHDAVVFQDANVKRHVTGGIMWAVRREHLIR